jgi:hypothetical protein
MKYIVILLAALTVLTGCVSPDSTLSETTLPDSDLPESAQTDSIPDMEMAIKISDDTKEWELGFMDRITSGILIEFVPVGDSINSWKEMVEHQIVFTQKGLEEYVAKWELDLINADSDIELESSKNTDNSITAIYTSIKANEFGIRRFIKASDGIYMVSYHARSKSKNDSTVAIWERIIATAELIPNPEK